jgi:O-antigen biosynthesis protein
VNPLTSVVTLTFNKLACTRRCLESLLATAGRPWELIVVENGSTDGTAEWLPGFRDRAAAAGVRVVPVMNRRNVGCSTARNQGIAAASGERVVFVDNDVALRSRGWLERLGRCLEENPRAGIVGPKLIYPFEPFAIQFAGGEVSRSGRVRFRGRGEPREAPEYNSPREVQCFISACFMTRRALLQEVGGFDEAFNPVEYEDIDLSYRIRSRGYRILYLPGVEMYHFENVTTNGTPALRNTYLIVKHGLEFKRRWRAMFEAEDGPADADTRWRNVEKRDFAQIGDLELTE